MEEEKEEDRRGEDGCRSFHVCTVEAKERERETERGAHAVVHAGIVGDQRYSARDRELETERELETSRRYEPRHETHNPVMNKED